jgi:catechol 2,3-dioxygenase-like lactoylglutathione lyase family enzyme
MPLGDPGGGLFEYTNEGLPKCLFVYVIPVSDPEKRLPFYSELLGMDVVYRTDDEIGVKRENARLTLRRSADVGKDIGLYIGVDDPYDLHRRLIDEGVIFTEDPKRGHWGVSMSFKDDDGNILHAIEMAAEPRQ